MNLENNILLVYSSVHLRVTCKSTPSLTVLSASGIAEQGNGKFSFFFILLHLISFF